MLCCFQIRMPIFISRTGKVVSCIKSQYYGPECKSDTTQFLKGNECPHYQLRPLQISETPSDISGTSIFTEKTAFKSPWVWSAGCTKHLEKNRISFPQCWLLPHSHMLSFALIYPHKMGAGEGILHSPVAERSRKKKYWVFVPES